MSQEFLSFRCLSHKSSPESVRSRDPASGTERLPFPSPDPEYQQFPPSIRAEIAPETPFVPHPNRGVKRSTRACAKHAPGAHRPCQRGLELRSREEDSTAARREVTTFFSLGFCVNVCVWRQSVKVELYKCACVNNKHIQL